MLTNFEGSLQFRDKAGNEVQHSWSEMKTLQNVVAILISQ